MKTRKPLIRQVEEEEEVDVTDWDKAQPARWTKEIQNKDFSSLCVCPL